MQTATKETSTTYFSEEATTTPRIWFSAEEEITKSDTKQPGGYLVWVKRLPSGRSTIHGCRVHRTVESSIVEESDLTINSRLDSYEPPVSTMPISGCIPFSSPISVYAPQNGNPTVVCLSTTIEMIALDSFGSESKLSEIQLHDRPTRIISGKFEGQQLASICTKIMGGNVVFHLTEEMADLSSSSSSSSHSSSSTSSSLSSVSSSSSSWILSSSSSVSSESSSLSSLSSLSSSSFSSSSSQSTSSASSSSSSPGVRTLYYAESEADLFNNQPDTGGVIPTLFDYVEVSSDWLGSYPSGGVLRFTANVGGYPVFNVANSGVFYVSGVLQIGSRFALCTLTLAEAVRAQSGDIGIFPKNITDDDLYVDLKESGSGQIIGTVKITYHLIAYAYTLSSIQSYKFESAFPHCEIAVCSVLTDPYYFMSSSS